VKIQTISNLHDGSIEHAAGFASGPEAADSIGCMPGGDLTAAEKRVLKLISQAKTNKEIAVDLCISPATVKRHLENILRKLGLRNRVEAAIYAVMSAGCPHSAASDCLLDSWRKRCQSSKATRKIIALLLGAFRLSLSLVACNLAA
jgi:DNA-binding CsgD family transcriptional regulator